MLKHNFNPVKVRDPFGEDHAVVLHPCQKLHLTLSKPVDVIEGMTSTDDWTITIYSPFLYLKEKKEVYHKKVKKHCVLFEIHQIYDVSQWLLAGHSLYLGEIVFGVGHHKYSLFVVARNTTYNTRMSNRVLTVINPMSNRIKLDLDETLEVVFYEHSGNDYNFWSKLYPYAENGSLSKYNCFELIREESVYCAEQVPISDNFIIMPRVISELPINTMHGKDPVTVRQLVKVKKQIHFWFRVMPEKYKEIIDDGSKPMTLASINFKDDRAQERLVKVKLSQRRHTAMLPLTKNVATDKEDSERALRRWLYLPKKDIATNVMLVNPNRKEKLAIYEGQKIFIEIAPPYLYDSRVGKNALWQLESHSDYDEDSLTRTDRFIAYEVQENKRICGDFYFQKFVVSIHAKLSQNSDMLFLGNIIMICKEASMIAPRFISLFLTNGKHSSYFDNKVDDYLKELKGRRQERPMALPVRTQQPGTGHHTRKNEEYVVITFKELTGKFLICEKCNTTKMAVVYDKTASQESKKKYTQTISHGNNTANKLLEGVRSKAIVLENPRSNDHVVLKPDEHLLLSMCVGEDYDYGLLSKKATKIWCVNPIQVVKQKFFLYDMEFVSKNGKVWQQLKVGLLPNHLPQEIGTHTLGGLRISNSDSLMTVLLSLEVDGPFCSLPNKQFSRVLRDLIASKRELIKKNKLSGVKEKLVVNPINNERVEMGCDQELVVRFVIMNNCVFYPSKFPKFLELINSKMVSDYTESRFRVSKEYHGLPDFISGCCGEIRFEANNIVRMVAVNIA